MYFQGKEIITMNRIVHIAKMNNNEEDDTNKQLITIQKLSIWQHWDILV